LGGERPSRMDALLCKAMGKSKEVNAGILESAQGGGIPYFMVKGGEEQRLRD